MTHQAEISGHGQQVRPGQPLGVALEAEGNNMGKLLAA